MEVYIRTYNYCLSSVFDELEISKHDSLKGVFGSLVLDKSNKYYPRRSDAKIMRKEVIGALLVIGEMMESLRFSDEILAKMSLFVSNGVFLERENKHISRIMKTFTKIDKLSSMEKKMSILFKSISPLTALETLTNSATSFIAQYANVKGNNTTFGNTSYGNFSAIVEGVNGLINQYNTHAMVGGVNGSGLYSALHYTNFDERNLDWKESACSAFVILQNDKEGCSSKIVKYKNDQRVPSLFDRNTVNTWKQFFDGEHPEMIIYSGGFRQCDFDDNRQVVDKICKIHFSWNVEYGSLGASSMTMNMIKAIQLIEEGYFQKIDLLDKDPYGRETYLQIAKV